MDATFYYIAILTAGIALALGLVSLFTSLHRGGDKVNLIFGIMCISLFIHFTLPPAGFILLDKPPYPPQIILKRVFNALYAFLFPWFVMLYTGYRKKIFPVTINVLYIAAFITMAFSAVDTNAPVWVTITLVPMGISLVHGLLAIRYQVKSGAKNNAYWFLFAMVFFAFFYLITVINQFGNNYFSRMFHAKIFFPLNLFLVPFMLTMGVRLSKNAFEKIKLETLLGLQDIRWHSLLENMQMIVLELDTQGRVQYINSYGVKILGCSSADEILKKDWFSNYLPVHEMAVVKSVFAEAVKQQKEVPHFKSEIKSASGKWICVSWTNIFVYDEHQVLKSCLSIGADITNEENAYREIVELKAELEKENLLLKGKSISDIVNGGIIGQSKTITYAIQKALQVAGTTATVLLEGETGVGKELFADLIHHNSLRRDMPLVKVNCGALPAELIEDELFGHEKGAFTGAVQSRKGRFEMANGGTIFLDEIGELPLALQPKLLRVLQNGEFERVGGQQTIKVDVRVVSATNKELDKEVQQGRFREDLYYRLNIFPITIPSLRSRKDDIPMLIAYFVEMKGIKHNKKIQHISKADINRLCEYDWPGNIRELKNVIERSVISANSDTLKLDWWGHHIDLKNNHIHAGALVSLEQVEKDHIIKLLEECNWKISGDNGAAVKLGINPSTLRSRIKKLNITRTSDNGDIHH